MKNPKKRASNLTGNNWYETIIKNIITFILMLFIIIYFSSCKKDSIFNNKTNYELLINTPRKLTEYTATYTNGETEDIFKSMIENYGYECYKDNVYEFKIDSVYNNFNICNPYNSKWAFNKDSTIIYIWEISQLKNIDEDMTMSEKKIIELSEKKLKIEYEVFNEGLLFYTATQTYETVK